MANKFLQVALGDPEQFAKVINELLLVKSDRKAWTHILEEGLFTIMIIGESMFRLLLTSSDMD